MADSAVRPRDARRAAAITPCTAPSPAPTHRTDLAARAVAQVFVHGHPGFEREVELIREQAHEPRLARGHADLAYADARANHHFHNVS